MKYLFVIPLMLAAAMVAAAEPSKTTYSTELQGKINELTNLQANYSSKYKRIDDLLVGAKSKIGEGVAIKLFNTDMAIRKFPASDYLECNGVINCERRDDLLKEAINDYKWANAKLDNSIKYLNNRKQS